MFLGLLRFLRLVCGTVYVVSVDFVSVVEVILIYIVRVVIVVAD